MPENLLCYGDNLDILRGNHIPPESVDLIYLDPPFNSNQDYNVLFREQDGARAAAQIKAFGDTWHWDRGAVAAYHDVVEAGGRVADAIQAMYTLLGGNDMMAYLTMMAPRLVELHRVLKPTGTMYLHCDPTASHYLKVLTDAVFGKVNFRNDIVWKRKAGRGETNQAAIRFGVSNDNLLVYAKSKQAKLTRQYRPSNPHYIETKFVYKEADGRRYRLDNITSPKPRPNLFYEYKGHWPPPNGWAVSRPRMEEMDRQGRLYIPDNLERRIQRKRYLDELPGETVDSLWDDIPPINSQAAERLGFPTQKPEALLDRIIQASSAEGQTVFDPFCGCGTAVASAQRLGRRWIGIDITHLAITLIRHRLHDAFGPTVAKTYQVVGEPVDVGGAKALAELDRYQFQWWALGLVGARPTPTEQKKGADKGIDGRLHFFESQNSDKAKQIIFSVKSGNLKAQDVRDLRGVIEREKAAIGVLLTLEEPTELMRVEAAEAGNYVSPFAQHKFSRLQILPVGELLAGGRVEMPWHTDTVPIGKRAPRAKGPAAKQGKLFDQHAG